MTRGRGLKNVDDVYPLSPMQSLMLVHSQGSHGDVLATHIEYEVTGPLDVDALRRAWELAVQRHPALRTAFLWEGLPEPVQVVRSSVDLPFVLEDLEGQDTGTQRAAIQAVRERELSRRFDVRRAPLMGITLIRTGPDEHRLLWSVHHLVMDRWSHATLFSDLGDLYNAQVAGSLSAAEPAAPFKDYVAWIARQDPLALERHWAGRLNGLERPTLLTDRVEGRSRERKTIKHPVTREVTQSLNGAAADMKTSLASLLMMAIAVAVAKRAGSSEAIFGLTVSGRPPDLADSDRIVGSLVSNVPIRFRLDSEERLVDWAESIRQTLIGDQPYQHASPADVQQWSGLPLGQPLYDVQVLLNLDTPRSHAWSGVELTPQSATLDGGYPVLLALDLVGGALALTLVHDHRLENPAGLLDDLAAALTVLSRSDAQRTVGELAETLGLGLGAVKEEAASTIDTAAVERALLDLPGIREAVVLVPGEVSAYLVPTDAADLRAGQIRRQLKAVLPRASVPRSINFVMSLPRTENGEVDEGALPPPAPPVFEAAGVAPQSLEETVIHRIWSEVLGLDDLSVLDDFFDIGGTSIQMLQIAALVEEQLSVPMPPTTFLQAPTVRQLASALAAGRDSWEKGIEDALIPINSSGSSPPLTFIHGRDGGVLFARFIAHHMSRNQPVFAIQAFGGHLTHSTEVSIEALAADYMNDVRKAAGEHPLVLGGYSLGGLIAWEIARQATESGLEVSAVVLIEPGLVADDPLSTRVRHFVQGILGPTKSGKTDPPPPQVAPEEALLPDEARAELAHFRRVLSDAAHRYRAAPLNVPVIHYASLGNSQRRRKRWTPVARGGLDVVELPANHDHIVAEPVVGVLAQDLQKRLTQLGL